GVSMSPSPAGDCADRNCFPRPDTGQCAVLQTRGRRGRPARVGAQANPHGRPSNGRIPGIPRGRRGKHPSVGRFRIRLKSRIVRESGPGHLRGGTEAAGRPDGGQGSEGRRMTTGSTTSDGGRTAVGFGAAAGMMLFGGFGAAGVALGFLVPYIAGWLARLPWAPFQGPARLISHFDGTWLRLALMALGGIAGLAVAFIAVRELLTAVIDDSEVRFEKDGKRRAFARSEIAAVFVDGKQLVVLGTSGHELLRENTDEPAK